MFPEIFLLDPYRVPGPLKVVRWWKRPVRSGPGAGRMARWDEATPWFLAAGSFLLLPGPLLWMALQETQGFALALPAFFLQFVGWALLGADIAAVPKAEGATPFANRRWMGVAYGLAWAGFLLGVLTLSLTIPNPFPTLALPSAEVLYVPTVYGPVLLAHAAIFALASRFLLQRERVLRFLAGATVLTIVALAGLLLQLLGLQEPWALIFAGTAGFGYLLAALA